jgi:hypothetical protein
MTFLAISINAQFNRTRKTREDQVSLENCVVRVDETVEPRRFHRSIRARTLVAEKRFELKKNTSRQVRGEVCLDGADVVIDGMWAGTISFRFEHNKGANGSQFYCLGCAKRSSQLVPNDSRFLADVSWGGTA